MAKKRYAEGTDVSVSQSRDEIERLLARIEAKKFAYFREEGSEMIAFEAQGRRVRFELPIPDTANAREVRRLWRGLVHRVKSRVIAVEDDIAEFDEEFLNEIVTADGRTVGQVLRPQFAQIYSGQKMPVLLPGASTVVQGEVE